MLKKLEKYWHNAQHINNLKEQYDYWQKLTDYADVLDILKEITKECEALKEENKRILAAINLLEGKQKIVMYLHCVKHMNWEEIARQLNTSNKTIYRHRDKALATMEGVAV